MSSVLGPLFSLIGSSFLGIAWLCRAGKLPRNDVVGMRTSATMASDAAWLAAHRASAWSIALAGAVLLGVGAWLLSVHPEERLARRVLLVTAVAVVTVVVVGGVQADRVARAAGR